MLVSGVYRFIQGADFRLKRSATPTLKIDALKMNSCLNSPFSEMCLNFLRGIFSRGTHIHQATSLCFLWGRGRHFFRNMSPRKTNVLGQTRHPWRC